MGGSRNFSREVWGILVFQGIYTIFLVFNLRKLKLIILGGGAKNPAKKYTIMVKTFNFN